MKYTKPATLAMAALALTSMSACGILPGGTDEMPEDPYKALTWAVENYTNGHAKDVAKAIPPTDDVADDYVKAIGNQYVTEKSHCQVDPDTANGHDRPGGIKIYHATVSCENMLPKAQTLGARPDAQFFVGEDGQPYGFQFKDAWG